MLAIQWNEPHEAASKRREDRIEIKNPAINRILTIAFEMGFAKKLFMNVTFLILNVANVLCKTLLYFEKLTETMIFGAEVRNRGSELLCFFSKT